MSERGVLLCFGMGFTGKTIGRRLKAAGWRVIGTGRSAESCKRLAAEGFEPLLFDGTAPGEGVAEALAETTHVLNSVPSTRDGDPVLLHHRADIIEAGNLDWIGVLSTIGVYGEHHGAWIDEDTPPRPANDRGWIRLEQERYWSELGTNISLPPHIFRLPGIYGPGRNQLVSVRTGKARRLVKPGQVFNRVHVEDIASAVIASMRKPDAGYVFNVADDLPAPPQEVVAFACELLGVAPPPEEAFDAAKLSPMAASFYGECKRVRNDRLKQALGVTLAFPTYREGLAALLAVDGRDEKEPGLR